MLLVTTEEEVYDIQNISGKTWAHITKRWKPEQMWGLTTGSEYGIGQVASVKMLRKSWGTDRLAILAGRAQMCPELASK